MCIRDRTVNGINLEDIPAKYVEVVSTSKMFKPFQVTTYLDYGQIGKMKDISKGHIIGADGKQVSFNGTIGVLNALDAQNLAYNIPNQTTPTLYPSPTSSLLALNSDKEYDIEVYDMAGNKVMALTGNTIDMSHLSSATYIVKALDKVENEEVSYKVVKN